MGRNSLSTQVNLRHRNIKTLPNCPIFGANAEDSFHALICCPHARHLWSAIRTYWGLPDLELFGNSREWILAILGRFSLEQRVVILMTLWRIWYVHNEVTRDKPAPPTEVSRNFLNSYIETLI